ncbi:MAG: hypothetical protein RBU21_06285 [FCB group bacterium]|jgi:hypothetical protein|nr:hypothetical protein [FCB group bacterium]
MAQVNLPARCLKCNLVFSSGIILENATMENSFEGCSTPCPRCQGPASIADGTFNVLDDVVTVINSPNVTVHMLKALGVEVRRAVNESAPPEELAQSVEKIDPKFGWLIRKLKDSPLYPLILVALYKLIENASVKVDLDVNKLIDQLIELCKSLY